MKPSEDHEKLWRKCGGVSDLKINIIFILLLERRHYDSFPVFKPSSDAILIDTAV